MKSESFLNNCPLCNEEIIPLGRKEFMCGRGHYSFKLLSNGRKSVYLLFEGGKLNALLNKHNNIKRAEFIRSGKIVFSVNMDEGIMSLAKLIDKMQMYGTFS